MLHLQKTALISVALAVAMFSSGCLETQKGLAEDGCKARFVGRQKAACDKGVDYAVLQAKKEDGKSVKQKYNLAVAECNHFERPLVGPCVDGVNRFRAELAKMDKKDQPQRQLASKKAKTGRKIARHKAADSNRAPASVPATTAPDPAGPAPGSK